MKWRSPEEKVRRRKHLDRVAGLRRIANPQGVEVRSSSGETGLFWLVEAGTNKFRSPKQGVTIEDLELLILLPEDDPRVKKIWESPSPQQDAE